MAQWRVGIIGLGGRGMGHLRGILTEREDVCVTYVCDSYEDRAAAAAKVVEEKNGNTPKITLNYREVCESDDVDVVVVTSAWENHIPACCYAGNQFRVLKYGYTPMFRLSDAKVDMPVTITDVPRLEMDGSGKIEVNTGDAATPCVGVFSPSKKRGVLVFTVQEIDGKNLGLAYEAGEIRLTWPVKRQREYRMCRTYENETPWEDLPAEIPCRVMKLV